MRKYSDLPSFPASPDDFKCNSHDQEDDNELKAAKNSSFLESLDDSTKFDYALVCAATLHHLYDSDNRWLVHFVISFKIVFSQKS